MSILIFILLTFVSFLSIRFLLSSFIVSSYSLNHTQKIRFEGTEFFWIFIFSTSLLALQDSSFGIDMMAIRLLFIEALCLFAIFLSKRKPILSISEILYFLFVIWMIIGCSYSSSPFYGLRVILKYLYPIIVLLTASSIVRYDETVLKACVNLRLFAIIAYILCFLLAFFSIYITAIFWTRTAMAIHFITITIFSLAVFYHCGYDKKDLFLAIIFVIPCLSWVFRTSIIGNTLALVIFFFFRYRIKSIPFASVILIAFISIIFFVPSVREKMFNTNNITIQDFQDNKISKDDIDSNGRFAMWEWSLNKFYNDNEIIGAGTGNLQNIFYNSQHPFLPIKICHNDYVQILCDNGLVGLILFGSSALFIIIHCFTIYQNKKHSIMCRVCSITAGASLAGMLVCMYTDNVVNYSMCTLSIPYGFYGMMLGLINKETQNAI